MTPSHHNNAPSSPSQSLNPSISLLPSLITTGHPSTGPDAPPTPLTSHAHTPFFCILIVSKPNKERLHLSPLKRGERGGGSRYHAPVSSIFCPPHPLFFHFSSSFSSSRTLDSSHLPALLCSPCPSPLQCCISSFMPSSPCSYHLLSTFCALVTLPILYI